MKGKKKIAIILMIVLVATMMPIVSSANPDESQVSSADQIGKYVDVYGPNDPKEGEKTGSEYTENEAKLNLDDGKTPKLWIDYSKLIKPTNERDKFEIELNVATNEVREKITEPTDVVLVFDLSGSMDYKLEGTTDGTAWKVFKPSMVSFINSFLAIEGNQLAIVGFAGNDASALISGWETDAGKAIGTFQNYGSAAAVRTAKGLNSEFTNAKAGFDGATAIIDSLDSSKRSPNGAVVFMSDGKANRPSSGAGSAALTASQATKAKLNSKYSGGKAKLYTFAVGEGAGSQAFMDKSATVDYKFTASNASNIPEIFESITHELTHNVKVWQVVDPMSEWVNYVQADGITVNGGNADYSSGTRTINWDLDTLPPPTYDKDKGTYTYTMSYFVTLNTDHPKYQPETFYPTNKETTLKYDFMYEDSVASEAAKKVTKFKIPTVQGEFGSITLNKEDAISGVKLSGGEFALKKGEDVIATAKAIDGTIKFVELNQGKYTVEETKAPDNYIKGSLKLINENDRPVTDIDIKGTNIHRVLTATNDRIDGSITLTKVDAADGTPLSGGAFSLWDSNWEIVATTSAIGGTIEFTDLDWGTYRIYEDEAPKGYDSRTFSFNDSFTVTAGALTHSGDAYKVTNEKLDGWVQITKTDVEDGTLLSGGAFALMGENNVPIATASAINGVIDFKGVPWGTYTVHELEAPKGYDKNSFVLSPSSIVIDADSIVEWDSNESEYLFVSATATNKKAVVQGEIITPIVTPEQVLGETADDPVTPQKVLGEEAKTSDSVNVMMMLMVLLVALAIAGGLMARRRFENSKK